MPKICVNGIVREMTAEEVEEMKRRNEEATESAQSPEERIAELEAALELLLSGVTE